VSMLDHIVYKLSVAGADTIQRL